MSGELARRAGAVLAALGAWLLSAGGREPPLTFALTGDVSVVQTDRDAYSGLREALGADATFGNLESPLTDAPFQGGRVDLRAAPQRVAALRDFTHLSIVNNHALDGGPAGERQTRAALARAGIHAVTGHVTFTSLRGVSVAWVAFLDDGRTPPPLGAVREAVRRARVVIVAAHWGEEYGRVTARQRAHARALVGAGATLIVGSGPHVLQGHERIGPALVLYSLGNLNLGQPYPATWRGAVVRVQVAGERVSACAVPTLDRAGRVRLASGEDRAAALARLNLPACPMGQE